MAATSLIERGGFTVDPVAKPDDLLLEGMSRHPDLPRLVLHPSLQRLAHPRRCIRRELVAPLPIEGFDGRRR